MHWAEDDEKQGNIISVPSEIYTQGCVQDVDDGLAVSKSEKKEEMFGSMVSPGVVSVVFPCSGLRKLAIQSSSRPLREEVGRESVKSKAPKTFQVSLDRSVSHDSLVLQPNCSKMMKF